MTKIVAKQKGFYFYEYMSDCEKFKEKSVQQRKFLQFINRKTISDKEYDQALKLQNIFGMKTMKEYRNLQLKCDVLLLGDVSKNLEIIV